VWLRKPEVAVNVKVEIPLGVPGLRGALLPPPPHPPTQPRVSKTRPRTGAKARPGRGSFTVSLKRATIASNASAKSSHATSTSARAAAQFNGAEHGYGLNAANAAPQLSGTPSDALAEVDPAIVLTWSSTISFVFGSAGTLSSIV
jgi:hypothetical protein